MNKLQVNFKYVRVHYIHVCIGLLPVGLSEANFYDANFKVTLIILTPVVVCPKRETPSVKMVTFENLDFLPFNLKQCRNLYRSVLRKPLNQRVLVLKLMSYHRTAADYFYFTMSYNMETGSTPTRTTSPPPPHHHQKNTTQKNTQKSKKYNNTHTQNQQKQP